MGIEKKRADLQKSMRDAVAGFSPGLAGYLYLEDQGEGDEPKYVLHLGNLPMQCPNCGRCRVNFYPDLRLIDCEKCDWDSLDYGGVVDGVER